MFGGPRTGKVWEPLANVIEKRIFFYLCWRLEMLLDKPKKVFFIIMKAA